MLDFPSSPTNGQKYPTPAVAGVPQYTWDGEKWTTVGGSIVSATPATATPLMDATPAVVGTTTKFAREDHVHPSDTTRAPFDAMAYSGMQINGGMEVSQERGANGTTATNSTYICDGWMFLFSGAMAVTGATAVGVMAPGFPDFLFVSVQTAAGSLGAGDYTFVRHSIEGFRIARLGWGTANAQPITIGFWSSHHRVGVYSGTIRNGPNNRVYAFTYTQAAADTVQFNTVTIPGDVTGTWNTDNTVGLQIIFAVGVGSTFTAPSANTWLAGNYFAGPGQINAVAATTDVFRLTGVIVLPGSEAPSAARSPFIMRPYDQELATCRRYYRKTDGSPGLEPTMYGAYGAAPGSTVGYCIPFQVPMRAAPSVGVVSGSLACINSGDTQPRIAGVSPFAYTAYVIASAAGPVQFQSNTCVLFFDARL